MKKDLKKKEKTEELTILLKKVQADFENYKKRVEKEKSEFTQFASQELIKKLLPLLDSFQLALSHDGNHEEFKKGVELIYSQLWQTLESEGLKQIDALDKPFDPFFHEALMQEESEKPENTVIEELQKGFMLKDNVVRPTKVKIAKKKKEEKK
ncbi:nucleotide exchange factor GrpE [Candidatus Woesearchaeota archaeon]|nr:nucleotide exchange factor GrpE [Candidatus Woesearchaeota archaeon]